jgi:hypothetical protein
VGTGRGEVGEASDDWRGKEGGIPFSWDWNCLWNLDPTAGLLQALGYTHMVYLPWEGGDSLGFGLLFLNNKLFRDYFYEFWSIFSILLRLFLSPDSKAGGKYQAKKNS